jgi:glycosyltransferase involved in cell wall biosynthesis
VSTDSPISVVIAAHNEAAVIGRCLDALLAGASPGELDVTVVANGCTDDTAAVAASRRGVRVIDRPEPGKVGALNAGDAVAQGFPRVYMDADIVLPPGALRTLVSGLGDGVHAVVPRRELDLSGRPLLIRAYYAINSRMPVYARALFGRGVIALSAAGRARFDTFPDVVADDLFLDSLFSWEEKRQVDAVASRIATPRRTRDLIRRLSRVRSGNASIRAQSTGVRRASRSSWLRDVVLPRPWLAPAGACYAAITLLAAAKARRSPASGTQWARDESSRAEVQA